MMMQPTAPVIHLEGTLLERFVVAATVGPPLTVDELSQLALVTSVGDDFFDSRHDLACIDLWPLRNVTSIGSYFLRGCVGLRALDLSPLSNVTSVGDRFLDRCYEIAALDLTPLRNLTIIGDGFLCWCCGITALDFSPLRSVTSIGKAFLGGCVGLVRLDLSGLRSVSRVGVNFLGGTNTLAACTGLTELASTPLAKNLGWDGESRDELARLLVASNKQRIANIPVSWDARKTALLIRNFAPRDHASDALKIWNVMRHVVRFLSPLRVPDVVLIAEEARMLSGMVMTRNA